MGIPHSPITAQIRVVIGIPKPEGSGHFDAFWGEFPYKKNTTSGLVPTICRDLWDFVWFIASWHNIMVHQFGTAEFSIPIIQLRWIDGRMTKWPTLGNSFKATMAKCGCLCSSHAVVLGKPSNTPRFVCCAIYFEPSRWMSEETMR